MDPANVRPALISVRISDDRRFLHLRFDSDDSGVTFALTPGQVGGLIADLAPFNAFFMEELKLQDAGPEGPGD